MFLAANFSKKNKTKTDPSGNSFSHLLLFHGKKYTNALMGITSSPAGLSNAGHPEKGVSEIIWQGLSRYFTFLTIIFSLVFIYLNLYTFVSEIKSFKARDMVNKITLIGNLGKDPDIRTLENGTKVCTFSLATNENFKDKNDNWQTVTDWHNIVAWRYLADKAERELKKGSLVYIEGKMTYRKFTDKEGLEKTSAEVVASVLQSLDKRENNPSLSDGGNKFNPAAKPPSQAEQDDDLPF